MDFFPLLEYQFEDLVAETCGGRYYRPGSIDQSLRRPDAPTPPASVALSTEDADRSKYLADEHTDRAIVVGGQVRSFRGAGSR